VETRTIITDADIEDVSINEWDNIWVDLGNNASMKFDSRDKALTFAEIMKDKILELADGPNEQ